MNHLLITGRVSDTPDRRVTPAGVPVTSFTLASNPPAPSRILYLKCVAWGDLAIQAAGLSRDMPLGACQVFCVSGVRFVILLGIFRGSLGLVLVVLSASYSR
ncbi:single-stranded DNA-binding protein, partial [Mobiluncus mulieris]|uniref:single-stranded DNA-binding protein n=1 Tax=Mobiluncus mulieris TaxID=2052 RepID=UPI0021E33CDB